MPPSRFPRLVICFGLLIAACTSSPAPTAGPPSAGTPTIPDATVGAIDHPTGATDVVLRLEQGGGFVPVEFLVTAAPTFTLYGDGTVIFRPNEPPPPLPDGVARDVPFRTARLSEDQVQALLEFALDEGGLALAKSRYEEANVADASTTTFIVRAGGLDKRVDVYALGEAPNGADGVARQALGRLADRLREFDQGGTVEMSNYKPERYRAVLWEAGSVPDARPRAWPWPELVPADFTAAAGGGGRGFPRRVMTPVDAGRLEIPLFEGGLQAVFLTGPDGKVYEFGLRSLLLDETS